MPIAFKGISKTGEKWIVPLVLISLLAIAWPWYYLLSMQGIFTKLTYFVTSKAPFYISSFLSLRIIYWVKKKWWSHVFNVKEFLIMLPFVLFANFGYTAVLFFWTTNMYDTEIWNGHVARAEYYEEWTEETETCTTDSDGNETCSTTYTEHPPYWQIITNNNETISISRSTYRKYNVLFHNEKFVELYRSDQVSYGDGNMYLSSFDGHPDKLVPTAVSHAYVNYIRAAEPLFLFTGYTADYADDLRPYPTTLNNDYGAIHLERVLAPNLRIDPTWIAQLNEHIAHKLAYLGKEKQVNALVYLTQRDTTFYRALHEMWYGGKKNDVIVLIGAKDFPKINWVRIMSWTDSKLFKDQLTEQILDLENIQYPDSLGTIITDQISKSNAQGGFVRKPMQEFHALRSDIFIPIKAYFIGILISLLIQLPLMGIFIFVDIE